MGWGNLTRTLNKKILHCNWMYGEDEQLISKNPNVLKLELSLKEVFKGGFTRG